MVRAKLCSFAIAGMIGLVGVSPMTAFAADTKTKSETQSEVNKNQNGKASLEEKMNRAAEKWDSLTTKQKDEVYALIENELQTEEKLMDKLVEFGVLEKEDATIYKVYMQNKYKKIKDSGEFPLYRPKNKKQ